MEASSNIGNHGSDWTRTRYCLPSILLAITIQLLMTFPPFCPSLYVFVGKNKRKRKKKHFPLASLLWYHHQSSPKPFPIKMGRLLWSAHSWGISAIKVRQSFMSGWYLSPTIYETLVHSSWLMATMSYGSCKKTLKTGWWVGTTSFPSCSLSSHNKVVTLQFP